MVRVSYFRVCAIFAAMIAMAVLSALLIRSAQAIFACEDPAGCPPVVSSTVPTDGKTGVDRDHTIRAQFTLFSANNMDASTINEQTFRLYEGDLTREQLNPSCTSECPPLPQSVSATVTYDSRAKLAVLDPAARLGKKTVYTAVVEGAEDSDGLAVTDSGDREMARDAIWHFKTGRR